MSHRQWADQGEMMDEIQVSAVFPKIAPGDLAEFKRAAAQVLELTIPEPGVVGYAWFFNEDETTCEVREVYADSDAMLSHIATVGDVLGPMVELGGGLEARVFGSPSTDLAVALAPFEPTILSPFQRK